VYTRAKGDSSSRVQAGQIPVLGAVLWILLLAGLGILIISGSFQPWVLLAMGLLAAAFGLSMIQASHVKRSGLEIPWFLTLASAGVAVWAAYDPGPAALQFARLLGAFVLFYAVLFSPEQFQRWVASGFLLAAGGLALYWPLRHDFSGDAVKFTPLNAAGRWLNVHLAHLPGPVVQANVAAGTLAVALPIGMALVWEARQRQRRGAVWFYGGLSALILISLVLTSSRGAWLGVLAAGGFTILAWGQRRWFFLPKRKIIFWAVIVVLALATLGGIVASGNLDRILGEIPDPNGSLYSRLTLWREGLHLIPDYLFVGSGLMTFRLVYAIYGIFLHVPFHEHFHNIFLEVWFEQGILGLLSLVWMGVFFLSNAWRSLDLKASEHPSNFTFALGWAGCAALLIATVHGMVDVVFYVKRTLPLIGLLIGFAVLLLSTKRPSLRKGSHTRKIWAWSAAGVLLLGGIIFHRQVISQFYANIGAVLQARTELSRYNPNRFADPSLDTIRRTTDLSAAEDNFQRALSWDRRNLTALQRLTEIAMSRGDYQAALDYIQTAWGAGSRDGSTRLLRGDALIAAGDVQQAADIMRGLRWAEDHLMFEFWYRYWTGVPPDSFHDYRRSLDALDAVLLIDPYNKDAAYWKAQAEALLAK
jgi:O-antigen ligase